MNTPHNPEAEKALLAAVIKTPEFLFDELFSFDASTLFAPAHRFTFEALKHCYTHEKKLTFEHLFSTLKARGQLEECGGRQFLNELWSSDAGGLGWALSEIIENHRKRSAFTHATAILGKVQNPGTRSEEILQEIEGLYRDFGAAGSDGYASAGKIMPEVIDYLEFIKSRSEFLGASTGISALDDVLQGIRPPEQVVVSAETGGGKTALGIQIAIRAAEKSIPVAIFSLEMPPRDLLIRMLSAEGLVSMRSMKSPLAFTNIEFPRFATAQRKLQKLPIFFDLRSTDIDHVLMMARHMHAKEAIGGIVVDYLQLLTPAIQGRNDNRERQVADMSRRLKILAKDLNIFVLALSQLNDDGRLRESRAIGQNADVILKILEPESEGSEQRKIQVIKNRNGRARVSIPVVFRGEFQRFENPQRTGNGADPRSVKQPCADA